MAAVPLFPFAQWLAATNQASTVSNDNALRARMLADQALGFADSAPSSPAEYDQWIINTTWNGFGVGNVAQWIAGTWKELAAPDGTIKVIDDVLYSRKAGAWTVVSGISMTTPPAGAGSAGAPGTASYDPDFFYLCAAADTWVRVALEAGPNPSAPFIQLLLHLDADTTDSSAGAHTVTASDSAATTDASKFGGASWSINGTDGYLQAVSDDLVLGTGDFTIDMWVMRRDLAPTRILFDSRLDGSTSSGIQVVVDNNGSVQVAWGGLDVHVTDAGALINDANFHHLEISRSGSTGYLFIDGELLLTWSGFTNNFASNSWVFGAGQYTPAGVLSTYCYLDEIRLVVGYCVHTEAFTPPTGPYTTF